MSLSATGPVRDWAADCYEEEAKVDNGGVIWGGVIGVKLWGEGEDQRGRIKCETLMAALSWGNWALRENEGRKVKP